MKKVLLVVAICLLSLSLVGCNKEKEKDNNKEISLYSDKTKIVFDNNGYYKMVYYYEGDKITGIKHYYDLETEEKATEKLVKDKEDLKYNITIKSITQEGRYVIYTMAESEYKDLTVEKVKTDYSYLTEVTK